MRYGPSWLTGALLLLLSTAARGQSADAMPAAGEEERWHFELTPYAWAVAIDGDARVREASTDVSASFSDILENLNFGFMGMVEARRDRFIVLFDGFGAVLEDDVDEGARTLSVPDFPAVTATIGPSHLDTKLTQVLLDTKLGWRVLSLPTASLLGAVPTAEDHRRFSVDLFGGGRYWYLKTELDVEVPVALSVGLPPGTSLPPDLGDIELTLTTDGVDRSFEESVDWIDPVVGTRIGADLTERLSLALLGDLGGFGIGSASKFTWNAMALVGWRLSERWTLRAGYKALNLQRDHRNLEVDLTMHGPFLGGSFDF